MNSRDFYYLDVTLLSANVNHEFMERMHHRKPPRASEKKTRKEKRRANGLLLAPCCPTIARRVLTVFLVN